ncbi:hypothetical protein L1987_06595 [Smallanthus sonchifolius]|uniref:Uncharacterized protein n=1 Tax=Smallanthus sonchifolius TaxID=185202 RepID=A0ACB9JYJ1_9ASTR|nr:hypothetical protein L1987_06595 [Smallanthus sonchifolius]
MKTAERVKMNRIKKHKMNLFRNSLVDWNISDVYGREHNETSKKNFINSIDVHRNLCSTIPRKKLHLLQIASIPWDKDEIHVKIHGIVMKSGAREEKFGDR